MAAFVCGGCFLSDDDKSERSKSRIIDKQLQVEKVQFRRTVKLLLLGSGASGKSTFLKQMKIINGDDFTEEEIQEYTVTIYGNIIRAMKVLIDAKGKLHIPWGDKNNIQLANLISSSDNPRFEQHVFAHYVPVLTKLWHDDGIKTTYDRRREFNVTESAKHYLDNIERIGQKNYRPSRLDILLARKATRGIIEHRFQVHGVPFCFVDVGGQRTERPKWFQCFGGVTSILFLVAANEFDQCLRDERRLQQCAGGPEDSWDQFLRKESRTITRLEESCEIFDAIVNNRTFANVSIILLLNKTDLLQEKIKYVSIRDYFEDFKGNPANLADVQKFELNMFDAKRRERSKPLFCHFTTAIDTENIRFVFQAVKDTILQDHLKLLMLQ